MEENETFTIALSNARGGNFENETASGTIINDDNHPTLPISNASVVEGDSDAATLVFDLSLSSPAQGDIYINYATKDYTAQASIDYIFSSGTLTINSLTVNSVITVPVIGDTLIEQGDETFSLVILDASKNIILGNSSAIGTIVNDDNVTYNDTGLTACFSGCTAPDYPGQDAVFGRDSQNSANSNLDGPAGFNFSQLDSNGIPLSAKSANYDITPWSCVLDNVTGQIWEVKTKNGGLQDMNHTYTWYNTNVAENGGYAGMENGGNCVDNTQCDTEKYIAQINQIKLCGYDDWRLPQLSEFVNLALMRQSPVIIPIDRDYFPNMGDIALKS